MPGASKSICVGLDFWQSRPRVCSWKRFNGPRPSINPISSASDSAHRIEKLLQHDLAVADAVHADFFHGETAALLPGCVQPHHDTEVFSSDQRIAHGDAVDLLVGLVERFALFTDRVHAARVA